MEHNKKLVLAQRNLRYGFPWFRLIVKAQQIRCRYVYTGSENVHNRLKKTKLNRD